MYSRLMILIFFSLLISCTDNKEGIKPRMDVSAEFVNTHNQPMPIKKPRTGSATTNTRLALDLTRQNQHVKTLLLKKLEKDIEIAGVNLQYDSIYFFRQKKLLKRNIGTQMEYDAKKNNYEIARKKRFLLVNKYRRMKVEHEAQCKELENNAKDLRIDTYDFIASSTFKGEAQ